MTALEWAAAWSACARRYLWAAQYVERQREGRSGDVVNFRMAARMTTRGLRASHRFEVAQDRAEAEAMGVTP